MKEEAVNLFFELIRVAVGNQDKLSVFPSENDWVRVFRYSQEQTLTAICFSGVERLPKEQRPPRNLLIQWYALTEKIERQSRLLGKRTDEAYEFFHMSGFATNILKGKSISLLYPNPDRRQSGDIDVWLDGGREKIYDFARSYDKDHKLYGLNYHHIHLHLFDDAEVEIHIYPTYSNNPFVNSSLHGLFDQHLPNRQDPYPNKVFNAIFILLHCYQHFLGHGVGLRQVMDYYYVLSQEYDEKERDEIIYWFKKLHLLRFASAIMWVLKEVFQIEEEKMIVPPNEKEGRFLLDEIMQTGNFGHYEKRHWGSLKTPFSRFIYNLRKDWHFLSHYPQEVMWQPFFSIWLFLHLKFVWK